MERREYTIEYTGTGFSVWVHGDMELHFATREELNEFMADLEEAGDEAFGKESSDE